MHTAYIALGSNLGDRRANILGAIDQLNATPGVRVLAVSPLLEYPAVDAPPGSPAFLNGAARLEVTLSPTGLLTQLLAIEKTAGRVRSVRNAPRPIDLDLLLFDDVILDTPTLHLPHPRMETRQFVLEPLAAVGAEAVHPRLGRSIGQLLNEAKASN